MISVVMIEIVLPLLQGLGWIFTGPSGVRCLLTCPACSDSSGVVTKWYQHMCRNPHTDTPHPRPQADRPGSVKSHDSFKAWAAAAGRVS